MTIAIPLLVCILGGVLYLIAEKSKAAPLFLHMFWCGLLVTLFHTPEIVGFLR